MSKKALIVTTVASTIDQFCMNNINVLLKLGYEVSVYANFVDGNNTSSQRIKEFRNQLEKTGVIVYDSVMQRQISKVGTNLLAYKALKSIIDKNNFAIIHCHTPIAALITRLAARKSRNKGTKVIYTAHGFHFYKGASKLNWLIYYPLEYFGSLFTDLLITINNEDYNAGKKLKPKQSVYMPGVGVDVNSMQNVDVRKSDIRKELGLPENSVVVLSVGELNKNKNHEVILRAIAQLNNRNVIYVIAGRDKMNGYLIDLSNKLNIPNQLVLLGYRKDIARIYRAADIYTLPSKREGLSVSLMEAMASGLPCVVSDIRGNSDLIDSQGGCKANPVDINGFKESLRELVNNKALQRDMGKHNQQIINQYDSNNIAQLLEKVYS